VQDFGIRKPGWELALGLLIITIWDYAPLPRLTFGDKWSLGSILQKNIILVFLLLIFLKLRKNSFSSMGLITTKLEEKSHSRLYSLFGYGNSKCIL